MLGRWSDCGAELITWINQREEKADCIQTASVCIAGATALTAWWIEGMRGMCWKCLIFQFHLSLPWSASCQSSITGGNLSWYSYSSACFIWNSLVVEISNWFPVAFLSPFPKRFPQSYLRWVSCLHKGFPCQCCWCSLSWQLHIPAKHTAPQGCASAD